MHRIFVYGTLKQGFPNHAVNRARRLDGDFVTCERFPLYLVGERYSPWLLLAAGDGLRVRGQVFAADTAALAAMDRLERVDADDGYRRVEIEVAELANDETIKVFIYGKPPDRLDSALIRSGPHPEYLIEHAALYRRREAT